MTLPRDISIILAKDELDKEQIAPNKFEDNFTYAELEKIIKNSGSASDFFQKFKGLHAEGKKIMQNFTFVRETRSSQKDMVSPEFPRVIRFNNDASLVMAYVSHPESEYANSLEIINFDHKKAKFNFYKVDFTEKKIQKNPKVCAQCHAGSDDQDLKPIWPSYSFWKGMFGENDDKLSKNEVLQYLAFRAKNRGNVRVDSLPFPESAVKTEVYERFSQVDLSNDDEKFNELLKITNENPYIFYPYLIHASTVEDFKDNIKKTTANYNYRNNLKLNDFWGHLNALRIARIFAENFEKLNPKDSLLLKSGVMYEGFACQEDNAYSEDLNKVRIGDTPDGFLKFFSKEVLCGIQKNLLPEEFVDNYVVGEHYHKPMSKHFTSLLTYTLSKSFGVSGFDWTLYLKKDFEKNRVFYNYGLVGSGYDSSGGSIDSNIVKLVKSALTKRWVSADPKLSHFTKFVKHEKNVSNFFGYEFEHIDDLISVLSLPSEKKKTVCNTLYKRMKALSSRRGFFWYLKSAL